MWEIVGKVSSVFGLLAFLAAAAVTAWRSQVNRDLKLIELTPPKERGRVIGALLERLGISTDGLSEDKRYRLAQEQLAERRRRMTTLLIAAVGVALVSIVAWVFIRYLELSKTDDKAVSLPAQTTSADTRSVAPDATLTSTNVPPGASTGDGSQAKRAEPSGGATKSTSARPNGAATSSGSGTGGHAVEVGTAVAGDRSHVSIANSQGSSAPNVGVGSAQVGNDSTLDIGNHKP